MEEGQRSVSDDLKVHDRAVGGSSANAEALAGRSPPWTAGATARSHGVAGALNDGRDLALVNRHPRGMLPLRRHPGALAAANQEGQALGDFVESTLARWPSGAAFLACGTLTLPAIGTVFYVILSDAPLAHNPKWVLILAWTSQADPTYLLGATDCGGVDGLSALSALGPKLETPARLLFPAGNLTC